MSRTASPSSTPTPAPPDQSRTRSAYGLQWNTFRIVRPEEDRATFRNRTGLMPVDLDGRVVLDAGCGMGRYLRVAAEGGATAVGMDLSRAVDAARDLTRDRPGVSVVQGDLLRLPFAPGSFDHIYSLGVLDHTPDPRRAFLGLAKLLRPGGRIAIWVYPVERPRLERIINLHRAVSTRLPLGVLVRLSRVMAPVGAIKRRLMGSKHPAVARLGVALNVLTIGVSMHPDPEVRVCDTLDWYAPPLPLAAHPRGSPRLVRRGRPRRRRRPRPRPGLSPRRPGQRRELRGASAAGGMTLDRSEAGLDLQGRLDVLGPPATPRGVTLVPATSRWVSRGEAWTRASRPASVILVPPRGETFQGREASPGGRVRRRRPGCGRGPGRGVGVALAGRSGPPR